MTWFVAQQAERLFNRVPWKLLIEYNNLLFRSMVFQGSSTDADSKTAEPSGKKKKRPQWAFFKYSFLIIH